MRVLKKGIKIFLTFFIIFSFFSQWNDHWDAEAIFQLIRAIVEEQRFEVDSFANTTPLTLHYNGHYYSTQTIGLPLIGSFFHTFFLHLFNYLQIPSWNLQPIVYHVDSLPVSYYPDPGIFITFSKLFLTIMNVALPAALSVFLVYKISYFFVKNEKSRILATITYGLGTSIFPYGISFYNLAMATFLSFLSFYILFKFMATRRKKYFLLAGIFSGFATLTYLFTALISLLLFFYILLIDKRIFMIFLLGYLICVQILVLYDYSIYQLPSGFFFTDVRKTCRICYLWDFPKLSEFAYQIPLRLFLDPYRGLFIYYPILIFSLIGLLFMFKHRKIEAILVLSLLISFVITITFLNIFYKEGNIPYAWWGYFSFGPRRFVLLMPFLILPLFYSFEKFNKKIILPFLFISIFINILGLQVWEDCVNKENYGEVMRNWRFFGNPILDRYLPLFLKNGPRSRLFENLLIQKKPIIWDPPNSPDADFLKRPNIFLFTTPIGMLTLKIPFLCILPLSFIIFLIWRKEITKKIQLDSKKKVIISVLIFLVLISFVKIEEFVWGNGWYLEGKWDLKSEHWMAEKATILYFSDKKMEKTLSLKVSSFFKPRNLSIYMNGNYVKNFLVKSVSGYDEPQEINQLLEFKKGLNIIEFSSLEGCEIPSEIGVSNEINCKSFKIGELMLK